MIQKRSVRTAETAWFLLRAWQASTQPVDKGRRRRSGMLSAHMLGALRTVWIVFKTSSIHLPSLSFRHVQTSLWHAVNFSEAKNSVTQAAQRKCKVQTAVQYASIQKGSELHAAYVLHVLHIDQSRHKPLRLRWARGFVQRVTRLLQKWQNLIIGLACSADVHTNNTHQLTVVLDLERGFTTALRHVRSPWKLRHDGRNHLSFT